jgi:hypothetical protein
MLQGIEIERIGGQVGGTEYVSLCLTFVGRGVFVGVGGGKVRGMRIGARVGVSIGYGARGIDGIPSGDYGAWEIAEKASVVYLYFSVFTRDRFNI